MREAALQHLERASIVIKAAAVADSRVKQPSANKIKYAVRVHARSAPISILKDWRRKATLLVGFAPIPTLRANAAATPCQVL